MEELHLVIRWFHVIAGIMWIGILFFFNFINIPLQKALEGDAKLVNPKMMPRCLWWFRWGAMVTFVMGLALYTIGYMWTPELGFGPNAKFHSGQNAWILMGMGFGTVMWFNVWFIIWPAQKKILGGTAGDDAPALKARASMASRINTYSSGPMLFGMLGAAHYTVLNVPVLLGLVAFGLVSIWVAYAHSFKVGKTV